MRLFVGIGFDNEVRDRIIEIQEQVNGMINKGNLFDPLNFHFTLRFIGEVPEESIPDIRQAMVEASENISTFEIVVDHLGRFQKKKRNVLWLAPQTQSLLDKLHFNLNNHLKEKVLLEKPKQSFIPHITLGRNIQLKKDWEEVKKEIDISKIKIKVSTITLFHSTRVEGDLRYIPIETIYLNR